MIVFMPDGDDGWYTTWSTTAEPARCRADTTRKEPAATYCVERARYEEYIVDDVVGYVDAHYRTIAERRARGIAGLSMGGYGAVTLALRYPATFASAASHSGVLAPLYAGPHPFDGTPRWPARPDSLRAPYGGIYPSLARAFGADTAGWWARDPARTAAATVAQARAPLPALFVDVGVGDAFLDQARAFRAAADRLGLAVTYAEWPGAHSWTYWSAHVGESLAWTAARLTEHGP
jgi:S-formylglutathione hydrolase FrmB